MKLIFYFLLLSFFLILEPALSQSIFKIPPNEDNLPKYEQYISDYAPSDSAYRVFNYLINSFINLRKPILSYQLWKKFNEQFPKRKNELANLLRNIKEFVIFYSAPPEHYNLYEQFIRDFATEEYGYVALAKRVDNYINQRMWDSAIYYFRQFQHLFPNKKNHIEKIIEILSAPTQGITIRNLGPIINTEKDEWDPCPTPDGRFLYFSTRDRQGGSGNSDVFVSENIDRKWTEPKNLGPSVNGPNDETIDNVSPDGSTLLLSGTFPGTFGKFDIYFIRKTEDGWGPLEHLPFPINTPYVDEGATISSDGNVLIFTSDRPGGVGPYVPYGTLHHGNQMGNMDLYVCFRTDTGWSQPINLGPTINTPYAERSPFLHPDGRTLYFSSDGHPGLGRLDVFKSVRLREDSWTEWSEPINLGKEINTILDDWGYKITLKGDSAFFAGHWRTAGYGGWDLYSVTLPSYAKPQPLATIVGKVLDPQGKPIFTKIVFEDLSKNKKIGTVNSNPDDGSYIIILPLGKNYGYYAEKEGYFPSSSNIDLTNYSKDTTIVFDIILYPMDLLLETQKKVRLNNIFFDFDKYDLKPESYPELDRVYKILAENPQYILHIEGHTDSIGTDEYNLKLSQRRAESVRNYLIKKGLAKDRIVIFGYGFSMPLASNETEEGRALNRRVEIWFVRKK